MVVLNVTVNDCTPSTIVLGRRGTYNTEEITFDVSYLIENYGDGTAVLAIKRSQDESAYPAVVAQDGSTLTWTVSETDTAYVGSGECQLMWYVDGGLAKTIIYPMVVMRDILSTAETPPDGYQTWVDNLTALGAETLQNAQNAAQSASDAETAKDNAEESAQRAEEAAEMLTNVSATATTLEPGQQATAEYNEGVFEFGIPKGEKGDKLTYADLTEADKDDLVQGPIKEAQDDAVDAVDTAKESAVSAVNEAGTTQVGNVNTAGATQVAAVEDKGEEVLESIPQDYTELVNDVADLSRQLSDVEEDLQITVNRPVSLALGGLDNTGKTTTATNRARCGMFFSDERCTTVFTADDGIEYRIATYRTSVTDTFIRYTTTYFITGATEIAPGTYFKILLRYADNPSAAISNLTELQNSVHYTCYFENDKKILDGMKLSLLGDSISAYAGTIPEGYDAYYTGANSNVTNPDQMWWAVLSRQLDLTPLVINAYSGSGITQLEDSEHLNKIPMSSNERCSGLAKDGVNPDIIIIAGGLNDYSYALSAQSEPLAWDGKTTPVEGNSFTEAYACMVKKLQSNYPNAIIVALSTWFSMRGDDNGYTLTHTVGNNIYTQRDYDEAIKFVADQMHIAYIDANNMGFNRNNFYSAFASDSSTVPTHPNKFGQSVMGMYLANVLPQIVSAFNYGRVIRR